MAAEDSGSAPPDADEPVAAGENIQTDEDIEAGEADSDERPGDRRGGPPRHIHAVLRETKAGWQLVLCADSRTTGALRTAGLDSMAAGQLTFEVAPNLVPGHVFGIDTIEVVATPADAG